MLFFAVFAIVMIGGSFALSLWIFPKVVSNSRYIGFGDAGMIEPTAAQVLTKEIILLIIVQMTVTVGVIFLVGKQLIKRINRDRPDTIEGYLFKISRITGKNEYEIFYKAAEDWPVSREQIERDFSKYIAFQTIPYYVNDFVRKNKAHIDKLHIPLFQFHQH